LIGARAGWSLPKPSSSQQRYPYRGRTWRQNPECTLLTNRNRRAYPTIQFQHRSSGPVPTPICTTFYVWAYFGLYAAPSIGAGEIFNDDLTVMPGLCGL
jgi:hypothetical protein